MAAIADEALCLRTWDWSETSQTAALFTRGHGLIRVLAKGSKRARAAFSGGLEGLTVGQIEFHVKASRELALLARWDLVETFPAVRADLPSHYAGLYLADLLGHFMGLHDPHPGLFEAVLGALRRMRGGRSPAAALAAGQWAVLVAAGYRPELDRSVLDGSALPAAAGYVFDPQRGGLTGPAETTAAKGADGVDWRLRAASVEALRRLAGAMGGGEVEAAGVAEEDVLDGLDGDTTERVARFLGVYLRHLLGQELPSSRWAFPDVGAGRGAWKAGASFDASGR